MIPSEIVTRSYFFSESPDMALISLVTEPANLWDEEIGIYVLGDEYDPDPPYIGANFWQDWERPAHIEFFEPDGTLAFAQDVGIRIYGGWNRCQPQKSLCLMARSNFGPKSIDYRIFPDKNIDKFKNILLRNSGNDWSVTHFRDALMQSHMADTALDRQAYRPALVFFNGEYMGIHNVRERINEHFLADNHDLNDEMIDLLEGHSEVIEGGNQHYLSLLEFMSNHDLSDEANYQFLRSQMDVENFAAYNVMEIFFGNTDWPAHNRRFWRPAYPDGRWRWIPYDLDFGLGRYTEPSFDTLAWALDEDSESSANKPWSTFMLRKLLENADFRSHFIALFTDWLNSRFLPTELLAAVDVHRDLLIEEMPRHLERWDRYMYGWEGSIENVREYILERPDQVRGHLMAAFGLTDTLEITLEVRPRRAGRIEMTGQQVDSLQTGIYFSGTQYSLRAGSSEGYRFIRWSGLEEGGEEELIILPWESGNLVAEFEAENFECGDIVINEINYHSAEDFDPGDWVEIVNCGEEARDLSAWVLMDSDDSHAFMIPQGSVLPAKEYLVLCRDRARFQAHFPDVSRIIGDLSFGFSASGDQVRLLNLAGETVDWVSYDDAAPWPREADGMGSTLQLRAPTLDNRLPESWVASQGHGSPGQINEPVLDAAPIPPTALYSPYPNPFNPSCTIEFRTSSSGRVRLIVYDIRGRVVDHLLDEWIGAGEHMLHWYPKEASSGIYLLRLHTDDVSMQRPVVLLK